MRRDLSSIVMFPRFCVIFYFVKKRKIVMAKMKSFFNFQQNLFKITVTSNCLDLKFSNSWQVSAINIGKVIWMSVSRSLLEI